MSGFGRYFCLTGDIVVLLWNQNIFDMESQIQTIAGSVVDPQSWLEARLALLEKERELTRLMDLVTDERRKMPREQVVKDYVFEGPEGKVGLAGLMGPNPRLIVRHFMFPPEWEEGCRGCSFGTDYDQGVLTHLATQGYAFAAVSLAPLAKLEAFKKKMGWSFHWVSSAGSDFDYDFQVAFPAKDLEAGRVYYNYKWQPRMEVVMPGVSLFEKGENGEVLHAWSGYGREAEQLIPSLTVDLVERNGNGPRYDLARWVRLRHRYENPVGGCCHG
jgi:predicted dithiol-disulfide oxidoreductase (DUF899 family)